MKFWCRPNWKVLHFCWLSKGPSILISLGFSDWWKGNKNFLCIDVYLSIFNCCLVFNFFDCCLVLLYSLHLYMFLDCYLMWWDYIVFLYFLCNKALNTHIVVVIASEEPAESMSQPCKLQAKTELSRLLKNGADTDNGCYSSKKKKKIKLIIMIGLQKSANYLYAGDPKLVWKKKRKQTTSTHLFLELYNRNQMVLHLWVLIRYARCSPECLNKKGTGQLSALLNQPWLVASPWKQAKEEKKLMTMNNKFQGQATMSFGCCSVVYWHSKLLE